MILGGVLAEAALVPRDEVLIFGDAGSEPAVSGGGFEVPDLVAVDEADAEAFGHPVHLDERAEAFDTFASRVDVGQDVLKTEFSATPSGTRGSASRARSLLKILSVALIPTPTLLKPALPQCPWRW